MPSDDTNIYSWEYTGADNQKFMPVLQPVSDNTAFTLSEGNMLIVFVLAAAAAGSAAVFTVVRKKKKPAAANGADSEDDE